MEATDLRRKNTSDPRIYFTDSGRGTPIVLGHSFLCDGEMWREQVRGLGQTYRLINVDFRGHGRSGAAVRPFTLYDAVNDVVGVLDSLGIDRAVWCGLSIGGMVALRAALVVPERVGALIIMDSDAGDEVSSRRFRYRLMAFLANRIGIKPFLGEISRLMFGATTRQTNKELVQEWRDRFAKVDVPSAINCLQALIRRDSVVDRLPEIEVPSLVIVGKEDRSLPISRSRQICEALPNSTYVEIARAGHLSAIEQPESVNNAIIEFVKRIGDECRA